MNLFSEFKQMSPILNGGGGGGGASSPGLGAMMRSPIMGMGGGGGGGLVNSCSQTSFIAGSPDMNMNMNISPMQCMNMNGSGSSIGGLSSGAMSMPMVRPCMMQSPGASPMGMMMRPRFMCPQPGMGGQSSQRFLSSCKSTGAILNLAQDPAAAQACFNCVPMRTPSLSRPMGLNM